ncbi:protein NETWORKED 4B-like [Mercurialis annua]|uniref:protein NETWORKED 4B-like n=1 Tax=Mercurialis annua TaxID=3986 RepID=UPI00215E18FE|nr:protein NETWORKED 4B-like [Mercurialis annua]
MESKRVSSSSLSSSPISWAPGNHSAPQESEWLRETRLEMNDRMKVMEALLGEDEDSSTRIENYDKRRLEVLQMLEEFNNEYCSLAEKYDGLMSKLDPESDSGSGLGSGSVPSSSNTSKKIVESCGDRKLEISGSCLNAIFGEPDTDIEFEYLKQLEKELTDHDYSLTRHQDTAGDIREDDSEQGNTWSDLNSQVTKLMEDNLQQQAELAKRNIEKKITINRLRSQIKHLKGENRELQTCMRCSKSGGKGKQMSKLKRMFSGKLFDIGCS